MNTIEIATLEEVTKDDETPAQADQVDGLVAVANGGSSEAQKEMADWLAARLKVESIPVKLKTLRLMTVLNGKGGANFKAELRSSAMETVQDLMQFTAETDPVHGDKPAQMVRKFAESAHGILSVPPDQDHTLYEKKEENVSSFLGKKMSGMKAAAAQAAAATTAAAQAASAAAMEQTAHLAEKAREEREAYAVRQRLQQESLKRGEFESRMAAAIATPTVSAADIVSQINATMATERDNAVAEAQKLRAELAVLQNGALMGMYQMVLKENQALKAEIAQVQASAQAATAAQAAAAGGNDISLQAATPSETPLVEEAIPPQSNSAAVDGLLSSFGAPAPAAAPAAAPLSAPATTVVAAAAAAAAAAAEPAAAAEEGPSRQELAAQARERARAQAKERAAAKKKAQEEAA